MDNSSFLFFIDFMIDLISFCPSAVIYVPFIPIYSRNGFQIPVMPFVRQISFIASTFKLTRVVFYEARALESYIKG